MYKIKNPLKSIKPYNSLRCMRGGSKEPLPFEISSATRIGRFDTFVYYKCFQGIRLCLKLKIR